MSEIKLLPCPFCGGEATFSDSIEDRFAEVHCIECGVKINEKGYPALSKTIKQWNTRKPMERIEVELMKKKIVHLDIGGVFAECSCDALDSAIEIVKEVGGTSD